MVNFKNIIKNPFYFSIAITTILFVIIFFIGYTSKLNDLTKTTYDISFINLFVHNSTMSLINVLGIFTLGLYNLYALFINAFDLGNIIYYSITKNGFIASMKIFVPHAVFELPSMIISLSIGFLPLSLMVLKSMKLLPNKISFLYCIKKIIILISIILLLNVLAALMESLVSV